MSRITKIIIGLILPAIVILATVYFFTPYLKTPPPPVNFQTANYTDIILADETLKLTESCYPASLSTDTLASTTDASSTVNATDTVATLPPAPSADETFLAPLITLDEVKIGDVTGDGRDDLLIKASSCARSAFGPDVLRIYTTDDENQIVPIKFNEKIDKQYRANMEAVRGRLGEFAAREGRLVRTFRLFRADDKGDMPTGNLFEVTYKYEDGIFSIERTMEKPVEIPAEKTTKKTRTK